MRPFQPTSPTQELAWRERTTPEPEAVIPGRLIAAPMQTRIAHIPYSLTYLLVGEHGELHLIDPGMDLPENTELLDRAARLAGARIDDIASVLVTHLHTDHMGMANVLRARTGTHVRIHRLDYEGLLSPNPVARGQYETWGVPQKVRDRLRAGVVRRTPITADAFVEHGEQIDLGGTVAQAVLTPGHTSGHLCFDIPELGVFLTGDHVLPTMNPGLGLGHDSESNPVSDYLNALDATAEYDHREALPGHGHRFVGLAARSGSIAAHVRRRLDEVSDVVADDPDATVWEVASRIRWGAGWENLNGFYMQSALYQTSLYLDLALTLRTEQR
jgi:glyoxylase-like metal-dependent hydrolase (beta-lactamase superfamily II)